MIHLELLAFTYGTFSAFPPPRLVDSRLECLDLCYRQDNCSSFFYTGGSCYPMEHVYAVEEQDISPGSEYFVWKSDKCSPGYIWYRSLGLCYKLYETQKTWQAAEDQCVADGGHLITVDSPELNDWMNLIATSISKSIWTGGKKVSDVWLWADNSLIVSTFWGPDQPDDTTDQKCQLIFSYSSGIINKLHDSVCDRNINFACQKITGLQQQSHCW